MAKNKEQKDGVIGINIIKLPNGRTRIDVVGENISREVAQEVIEDVKRTIANKKVVKEECYLDSSTFQK